MALDVGHIDDLIDILGEMKEGSTIDLLWLGCHLLRRGEKILAANGLRRPDLKAAVTTVETIVVGRTPDTPSLRPIVEAQWDQLQAIRSTVMDTAARLDHDTAQYTASIASLDAVIAAMASLRSLLDFARLPPRR